MTTATQATAATQHTNGTTPSAYDVLPVSEAQPSYTVHEMAISQIVIPEGRRDPQDVDTLAKSIQHIGLLHPITVVQAQGDTYHLVAGRNRLAAYTYLERTRIPAHILTLDDLHTELATIDENLIRHELTVLEYAEQLQRRKEVYVQFHPETKRGGNRHQNTESVFCPRVLAFLDQTAQLTGQGRTTVAEVMYIADHLDENVKCQLRGTPIEHRKTDLLRLAKMTPTRQRSLADMIVTQPVSTVAQAERLLDKSKREQDLAHQLKEKDAFHKIFLLLDLYAKELAEKEGLQVATNFSPSSKNESWINIRLMHDD